MVNNISHRHKFKLRAENNWGLVFKGETKNGPSLSMGSKGCLKYHINGVFYFWYKLCISINNWRIMVGKTQRVCEAVVGEIIFKKVSNDVLRINLIQDRNKLSKIIQ